MEEERVELGVLSNEKNISTRTFCFIILLPVSFLLGLGVSLGMTWGSCYAACCTEHFFPSEARLHVGIYYAWLFIVGTFLWSTSYRSAWSRFWNHHYEIPLKPFGTWHPNRSELLFWFWLLGIIGIATGLFWIPMWNHFYYLMEETQPTWSYLVTFSAVSGHWCDILLGLVFLSIGRNSTLAHLFLIPVEHSIHFHKVISYLLLICTLIHMVPYYTSVGYLVHIPDILGERVDVDNPYYGEHVIAIHQRILLASGVAGLLLLIVITITSLPTYRANNYNLFYFTHFCFLGVIVLACIHATTDFYLVLPGLLTYIVDGIVRLKDLNKTYRAKLIKEPGRCNLFRIQMIDQPRRYVQNAPFYYYIMVPSLSKKELHPFTSPSSPAYATSGTELSFLLNPVTRQSTKQCSKKPKIEWTQKLHNLIANVPDVDIRVRLEGPFCTPIPALKHFDLVLCIVGGTGITGALSLAHSVIEEMQYMKEELMTTEITTKCIIVWSTREDKNVALSLPNVTNVTDRPNNSMVTLKVHNTSKNGRLDIKAVLEKYINPHQRPFVYTSGPVGLMELVAKQCKEKQKTHKLLDWHQAQWDS